MLDDIPCEYVPLTEYKWHPASYVPWDTCPTRYPWNPVIYTVIASFQACTFCIAVELTGQVFARFRRKHSLYFWSILLTTWGAVIFAVATILETFTKTTRLASALLNLGWVLFTTFFSFTLYSRLYLLQPSPRLLFYTKWVIMVDSILFLVPTVVTTTLLSIHEEPTWFRVAFIVTKTEVVFTVQEAVITTGYVWLFVRFTNGSWSEPKTRFTLWSLVVAESFVIATDIVLIVLLYTENFLARQMVTAFTVALKLRIEFLVLNGLVDFAQAKQHRQRTMEWQHGDVEQVPSPGVERGVMGGGVYDSKAEPEGNVQTLKLWGPDSGSSGQNLQEEVIKAEN